MAASLEKFRSALREQFNALLPDPKTVEGRTQAFVKEMSKAAFFPGYKNGKPDLEKCERLLAEGIDTSDTRTIEPLLIHALHAMEVDNRYTKLATGMYAAGVNVDAEDNTGWTGLLHAAMHNKTAFVHFLLEKGADPSYRNKDGHTVLEEVTWRDQGRKDPLDPAITDALRKAAAPQAAAPAPEVAPEQPAEAGRKIDVLKPIRLKNTTL